MDSQSFEVRLPKYLRSEAKRQALEELIHWWHATVGSSPMSVAHILARVPYPSRIHAALMTIAEHADPDACMIENYLIKRMTGRFTWTTDSGELKLRIVMTSDGILFLVTPN